jgi:hypothetical protein
MPQTISSSVAWTGAVGSIIPSRGRVRFGDDPPKGSAPTVFSQPTHTLQLISMSAGTTMAGEILLFGIHGNQQDQIPIRILDTTKGYQRHDKLHDRLTHFKRDFFKRDFYVSGLVVVENNTEASFIGYFPALTKKGVRMASENDCDTRR